MIAYIKGALLFRGLNWAVVSTGGLGYKVMCPSRTLDVMAVGDEAEFFVHTAVRENDITLYGFADGNDMDVFHALTSLQGVGPAMALSLLGIMGTDEISQSISGGDINSLCRAPGIGRKIATRIISELAGSPLFKTETVIINPVLTDDVIAVAVDSMLRLGFRIAEARARVAQVTATGVFTKAEDIVVRALKNT